MIGIHQDKNESSSTRRGLRVGTENTGFHRGFKGGVREIKDFGFKKRQQDFLEFLLRSKSYGFFLLWFVFYYKGCLIMFYALRVVWPCFALRGCLKKFLL